MPAESRRRDGAAADGAESGDTADVGDGTEVPGGHRRRASGLLRTALAFLTVLPVGHGDVPGRGALMAFPVAGLVVGAAWAMAGWAAGEVWGGLVAAAAVLLADLLVTGGLHLDALADTADGVASRGSPQRTLEVMRDPRVGAVGAATLGVALLLRFALLAALLDRPAGWLMAAVAPVAGRVAMVWMLGLQPAGRGSLAAGPGATATPVVRITTAVVGGVLATIVVAAAGALGHTAPLGAGTAGVVAAGAAAMVPAVGVAESAGRWWRHRVGLASGDAVGAAGVAVGITVLALLTV